LGVSFPVILYSLLNYLITASVVYPDTLQSSSSGNPHGTGDVVYTSNQVALPKQSMQCPEPLG